MFPLDTNSFGLVLKIYHIASGYIKEICIIFLLKIKHANNKNVISLMHFIVHIAVPNFPQRADV